MQKDEDGFVGVCQQRAFKPVQPFGAKQARGRAGFQAIEAEKARLWQVDRILRKAGHRPLRQAQMLKEKRAFVMIADHRPPRNGKPVKLCGKRAVIRGGCGFNHIARDQAKIGLAIVLVDKGNRRVKARARIVAQNRAVFFKMQIAQPDGPGVACLCRLSPVGCHFRRRRMTTSTEAISAPSGASGTCVILS